MKIKRRICAISYFVFMGIAVFFVACGNNAVDKIVNDPLIAMMVLLILVMISVADTSTP